jgi:hypothetical protein
MIISYSAYTLPPRTSHPHTKLYHMLGERLWIWSRRLMKGGL